MNNYPIKSIVFPNETPKYINDFDTWKLYHAIRLHYNTDSYSVTKYSFSVKKIYNWDKYMKASDWEVRLFNKWAKEYMTDFNVKVAMGAFFFYHRPVGEWQAYPDSDEVKDSYNRLKSFLYSPKYFIDQDLTYLNENYTMDVLKITNGNIPKLYQLAHKGEISYETLATIDQTIALTKYVSTKIDTLTWKSYKDWYVRYQPFVCTEVSKDLSEYIKKKLLELPNSQNT